MTSMIAAIIALSLVVLVGLVGQIPLAQAAFCGAACPLEDRHRPPFPISLVAAALVSAALGILPLRPRSGCAGAASRW